MSQDALPDETAVHRYSGRICFKTGPPHHVGAELEWLLAPISHPVQSPSPAILDDLVRAATPLPAGSRATLEPGGQIELSSPVGDDLSRCWKGVERDTACLHALFADHHLTALPVALDPIHTRPRVLRTARYDAMQDYFDRRGDAGLMMMTSSAAEQINLDAGADRVDVRRRWSLLHGVGPALVAAFANSPVQHGRPTGWKSTRQRVLQSIDPARMAVPTGPDPAAAWAEYALKAPVMVCRRPEGWLASPGFTFGEWIAGISGIRAPTEADLAYHLSTLFPPVRPRGWLEVRYIDAQPAGWWPVPLAVLTALANEPGAADTAREATDSGPHDWGLAARQGLADPGLCSIALRCFQAALDALPRMGTDPALIALVAAFVERYVARGRCPADDVLDGQFDDHRAPSPALTGERS